MRVFHADSPSLHARDSVHEAFILAVVGFLQARGSAKATATATATRGRFAALQGASQEQWKRATVEGGQRGVMGMVRQVQQRQQ